MHCPYSVDGCVGAVPVQLDVSLAPQVLRSNSHSKANLPNACRCFAMGTTLTFVWGRGNANKASCFNQILSSLCKAVLGRIVPVVHLTSVHVWKLKYWTHAFPPSEDPGGSGFIPTDAIQDILRCDAQTLFTWVGLRGEVMRKTSSTEVKPVYKEYPSTYVPLVVMLSLWMYERLGQAAAAAKANAAKAKPDGSPDPSPSAKRVDVQGLLEKSSQFIQLQYKWILNADSSSTPKPSY